MNILVSKRKIEQEIAKNGIESIPFYLDELVKNEFGIDEFQIEYDSEVGEKIKYNIII